MRESVKRNVTYLEIAEQLRREILEGKLKPGTPVLSSRELARTFGVSLSTAHKAANCLVREALIYRRQGSGTFVNSPKARSERVLQIGCAIRKEFEDVKIARLLSIPGLRLVKRLRASVCACIPAVLFKISCVRSRRFYLRLRTRLRCGELLRAYGVERRYACGNRPASICRSRYK